VRFLPSGRGGRGFCHYQSFFPQQSLGFSRVTVITRPPAAVKSMIILVSQARGLQIVVTGGRELKNNFMQLSAELVRKKGVMLSFVEAWWAGLYARPSTELRVTSSSFNI